MPAASAVVRCAASSPLKNRSPWPADRPCAPALGACFLPAAFASPGKTLPGPWRNSRRQRCSRLGLISKARLTSAAEAPCSSRSTAAKLELLRESASRQTHHSSSLQWILSLNWLSHFWGQVHTAIWPKRALRSHAFSSRCTTRSGCIRPWAIVRRRSSSASWATSRQFRRHGGRSFLRHGEIFRSDGWACAGVGREAHASTPRPIVSMSFQLAVPWLVTPPQSPPPLHQPGAIMQQSAAAGQQKPANGQLVSKLFVSP